MNIKSFLRSSSAAFFIVCCSRVGTCEVRMPAILSSHMVLQRDRPIHVWGWSEPGEKVTVALHGVSRTTTGDGLGEWSLYLPPEPAGGPFQLTIASTNTIVLDDVLIGDVWFASGQSNMEMPLKGFTGAAVKDSAEEIRQANHTDIRLLHVPHKASDFPLRNVDSSWTVCTPETAANFSAAAYFFGRDLAAKEHVPIGLIDATWGGTVAEAWLSLGAIASDASLMPLFGTRAHMIDSQAQILAIVMKERREDAAARSAGQPPPQHPWHPDPASWGPAALFNGMVAPEVGYAIKGVIWYQGESNSRLAFAPLYERVFRALIAAWRAPWHVGDFPFLFVQISDFKSGSAEAWPIIREAQRRSLALANTAMAVSIDIGNPDNVHPADKQTVGIRLALAARALAYGEPIEYSGPLFRQATADGQSLRVWFDHAGGLLAKGPALTGFEIAGDDRRFVSASARIDGGSVLVMSPQVETPKYVRYGWANSPLVNLFNSAGLPASPFTSEDAIPAP